MSEFDDFVTEAFAEAAEIIGQVKLTIVGFPGVFEAIEDRTSKDHDREAGGLVPEAALVLLCGKAQFSSEPPVGRDCEVGGAKYRIDRVESDVANYTLYLTLRVQKRGK